jgi:hypothetical protein
VNLPRLCCYVCACLLGSTALAACGNNGPQRLSSQGYTQSPLTFAAPYGAGRFRAALHSSGESGSSWMAPDAVTEDLIYVSNLEDVKAYSYPGGKHVGTLKGFYRPLGECVDNVGDVFIADQDTIVEYTHGGKKPVRTLTFPGYSAVDCASDSASGELAVTWYTNSNGYVAIYQDASGTPTLYSNGNMIPYYCGFDDEGNLFVDGTPGEASGFMFAELPKDGNSLVNVSLDKNIGFGGFVQWDGKHVAVEDIDAFTIYRFAISSFSGTLKGATVLNGLTISNQGWIVGHDVLMPNVDFVKYQPLGQVLYYTYPKGGSAIKTILDGDDTAPYGVTVSLAPH